MGYRNIKKQKKLISFLQIEDFDFSMSRDNAYYQFYKNAPVFPLNRLVSEHPYLELNKDLFKPSVSLSSVDSREGVSELDYTQTHYS